MKKVKSSLYTKEYYLSDCSGYQEFKKSFGEILEPRLERIVKEIPLEKGVKVLDIGCGRGEMVFWAVKKGAEAVGIDYSPSAIKLAKQAQKKKGLAVREKIQFIRMEGETLKFPDETFDAVFLIEVLEHLYPQQAEKVLSEIKRVLKDKGFLFVHTAPSRWFNDFTYRYYSYPVCTILVGLWDFLSGKKYPNLAPWKNLRTKSHKLMHVNEPNYFYLKKLFSKSGFRGAIKSTNITVLKPVLSWKDALFNALVFLYPLSSNFPFNVLWGNDFIAVLRKNK